MAIVNATEATFDQEVQEGVTLVDFWAPWCGPCKRLAPVLDQLAEEYEGRAKIVKVNVDEQPGLAGRFGVMSIPTMIIIKDGQNIETEKMVGLQPAAVLQDKLNAQLG